jgi:Uma2 family endonuclease
MAQQLPKRWITVMEFEDMFKAGIFRQDERLELIEGEVFAMSPIGISHARCVNYLVNFLVQLFAGKIIVSAQNPITIDDYSQPQPDIALLQWRADFYGQAHPRPHDILLAIEVADTTVSYDRKIKIPCYSKADIHETWIVNIPAERIEIYAQPVNGEYSIVKYFQRGEEVQSHTISELKIGVNEILG